MLTHLNPQQQRRVVKLIMDNDKHKLLTHQMMLVLDDVTRANYIESLDGNKIIKLLGSSPNPEGLIKTLGDKGVWYIQVEESHWGEGKFTDFNRMMEITPNPEGLISALVTDGMFEIIKKRLEIKTNNIPPRTVSNLVVYSPNPEDMINRLGWVEFMKNLKGSQVEYLLGLRGVSQSNKDTLVNMLLGMDGFIEDRQEYKQILTKKYGDFRKDPALKDMWMNLKGNKDNDTKITSLVMSSSNPEGVVKRLGQEGKEWLDNLEPSSPSFHKMRYSKNGFGNSGKNLPLRQMLIKYGKISNSFLYWRI
jgi:hypothetical protein